MTDKSYFPICPICNFHAEMYFGTWQMCKHQREQEQQQKRIKELKKKALDYPLSCPFCESHNIVGLGLELTDDPEIVQKVSCQECNKTWKEFYKLHDVEFEVET
jgi:hypothetical protein